MKLAVNIIVNLCFLPIVIALRDVKIGKQNVLLHEAVRNLLGYKESPSRSLRERTLHDPNELRQEAPKYMLDLYTRFRNTQISKGQLSGNTVRSIHAELAEVNGTPMFVFNLTSVIPSETVLSAEVHFYKRKPKIPLNRRRDFELLMYEIAPHYMTENGKITMRSGSFGWQWYDVTDAATSCLAARRETPHLFALTFQVERKNGKVKAIPLKKFIRHHSMPFLIIYSNDTQSINLDQLDNISEKFMKENNLNSENSNKDTEDVVSSDDNSENIPDVSRTSFGQHPDTSYHNVELKLKTENLLLGRRKKRSVFDNEIPEDPVDFSNHFNNPFNNRKFNIPDTHPGILQSRRESRHKISNSRLIPYPKSSKRRKNRRRNRRRKNKLRRRNKENLLFPKEWSGFTGKQTANENTNLCAKKKLILDFADIGWEDKIIAPKSFEAHYCAGSCPFPLTKKLRPSNHATIQSIVNAVGIHTDVPAPCCVPESMSSVTLLYFDENKNVVLKNYPSMSVNSCACR